MKHTVKSEVPIEDFIVCLMWSMRISKRLYRVRRRHLWIDKYPIRGKLLIVLKEHYPKYNFYWETPRTLIWF